MLMSVLEYLFGSFDEQARPHQLTGETCGARDHPECHRCGVCQEWVPAAMLADSCPYDPAQDTATCHHDWVGTVWHGDRVLTRRCRRCHAVERVA
jgi:hypothetical protein